MGKGMLESWIDGVVEKVAKVVAEEGVPALIKLDQVMDTVEAEASKIKRRGDQLLAEAEREKERQALAEQGVVDAEFTETTEEKK